MIIADLPRSNFEIATNNRTYRVQNDTYTYNLNNNNISILIATRGGNIIIKKEIIKGQAAYINKNNNNVYG